MQKINYRPVSESDIENHYLLFQTEELRTPDDNFLSKGYLKGFIDVNFFIGGFDDNLMVGAVLGELTKSNGFMIFTIVVYPKYRSQGIGRTLLEIIETNAKKKGANWSLLYASNYNPKTLDFYQARGYIIGNEMTECVKGL